MDKEIILVVDDEPDILETISEILNLKGYAVFTARNGNECLEKLDDIIPDIILLDIMMPGLTTKEILDQIEQDERLKDTKIIFITAVGMTEAEKEELLSREKVIDFIQKPFELDELLSKIKAVLG